MDMWFGMAELAAILHTASAWSQCMWVCFWCSKIKHWTKKKEDSDLSGNITQRMEISTCMQELVSPYIQSNISPSAHIFCIRNKPRQHLCFRLSFPIPDLYLQPWGCMKCFIGETRRYTYQQTGAIIRQIFTFLWVIRQAVLINSTCNINLPFNH